MLFFCRVTDSRCSHIPVSSQCQATTGRRFSLQALKKQRLVKDIFAAISRGWGSKYLHGKKGPIFALTFDIDGISEGKFQC